MVHSKQNRNLYSLGNEFHQSLMPETCDSFLGVAGATTGRVGGTNGDLLPPLATT
jgi:hypothetical protein